MEYVRHDDCVWCKKPSRLEGLNQVCDVCLAPDTKEALVESIKKLRAMCESEVQRQIDCFMAKHHPGAASFWARCYRASIEVDTWTERQKRMCYDQEALRPSPLTEEEEEWAEEQRLIDEEDA